MPALRRALRASALVGISLTAALSMLAGDVAIGARLAGAAAPKVLPEGWTPWSHWVGNTDGTVTRTIYPDLTFHTDQTGAWTEIDPTVVSAADGAADDAATVPGAVRPLAFGRTADRLLAIAVDGGPVTLSAPSLRVDPPEVAGSEVSYVVPDAHAVLSFASTATGVKQAVTLHDATSPTRYVFHLADPNGVLGNAVPTGDGGYTFDKPVADGLFLTIPAPLAYEVQTGPVVVRNADGEVVPSAGLNVTRHGDGFDVVEAVDAAWLAGKSFPVVLDPSLTWTYTGSTSVVDCAVTNAATGITTPDCASASSQVGGDVNGLRRLLLRYDTSDFPSPASVVSATVKITPAPGTGAGIQTEVREAGQSWTTGATWLTTDGSTTWPVSNQGGAPGATQLGVATLTPGGSVASFSSSALTSAVAGWINGSVINNGLVLKATAESATGPGLVSVHTTQSGSGTSRPALVITYNAPPEQPTNVAAARGDQSATVSWTSPADNGSALTGYTITTWSGASAIGTTSAAGNATSKLVTGLTNGTPYTFTVKATNSIGSGNDSAPSNAVTPAGVPYAPTNAIATRGDQQLSVTWTAANGNGDAVTGNTVKAYAGATLVATVDVGAVTSATVTGLTNGVSYTVKVNATNTVGSGPQSAASNAVTPAGVPFAPTSVSAVPGNGAATVTWGAASPNGSALTGNTISAYAGAALAATATVGAVTSGTVTGLVNGTTYTFKVAATNDVGTGPQSAASNAVVAGTPGAPTGVTATRGDQSATVSWTAPAANGGAITGNTINAYSGATLISTTNVGATTSGTVPGLTNGTAYTFRVVATNTYGSGLESASSNSVTPAGAPLAPATVTATAGDAQATVTWTAANGNGDAVTGYTVKAYDGATLVSTSTAAANATSKVVTGLTNGTSYTFTVAATNTVGTGASTTSNAVTPAGVPSAPVNVAATAGDQQLTVTWTAAAGNGSAVTGYTVKTYTGATLVSTTPASGTATSATVTGLTNATAYYATITATNAVGTGTPATSNTVTPAGLPFAPSGVTATRGDSSAVVSWTAPGNNGSAITGYVVKAYDGATLVSTTNVGTVTSTTITLLTNGTAYTFKVAAVNGLGVGADSAASNAVTPAGVPFAPSGVTATRDNNRAAVSWTAANNNGTAVTNYTVKVYSGATLVSSTGVGNTTSWTASGLTNGTSYTFTVTATNSVGTGPASAASNAVTPAGLPFQATGVSGVTGNASAVVSWTAPGDNGDALTSYTIKAYVNQTLAQSATVTAPATSGTITGLTNGTIYQFRIAATNTVGTGNDSSLSGYVQVGVPGLPPSVSAVRGDQSATVSWTAPVPNGAAVAWYHIWTHQGATSIGMTTVGAGTSSTVISGLTNGLPYTFWVSAENTYGNGDSTPSNTVTPAGVPFAPTGVTATDGDQSATVSWTAPNDNSSAITGYAVKAYNGGTLVSTMNVGNVTSAVVTGLTNGVWYTFTVAATNAVGTGATSMSNGMTPAGVPFQPPNVTTQAGDTTIAVTWVAPSSNGSQITSFQITLLRPDGSVTAPVSAEANATQATLTGLTNGTAYEVQVRAVNRVGAGTPQVVTGVTPTAATAPASYGEYVPVTPVRVVDTRSGLGGSSTALSGGTLQSFTLTGVGGVPDTGVSAVAISVAAITPSAASYLTVWPAGRTRPLISQVTMAANTTAAGLVIAKLGASGQVSFWLNTGTAHLLVDVQGYYTDSAATTGAGRFAPLNPAPVADTTTGLGDGGSTPLASNTARAFTVGGIGGVPSTGVQSVVLSVTATQPTGGGYFTVYRNGDARPGTSNVNFAINQTVTSTVEVQVDSLGRIAVWNGNAGTAHVKIDVQGYYTTATGSGLDLFVPVNPTRIYNTVAGQNTGASGTSAMTAGSTRSVLVGGATDTAGAVPVPTNATAAVLAVQASGPSTTGFLRAYPSGESPQASAFLYYGSPAGANYTGTLVAKLGTDHRVNIYESAGTTHLIVDVMGYFVSSAPAAPLDPTITTSYYPQNQWPPSTSPDANFVLSDASLDLDHFLWALDDPSLTSPTSAYPASGTTATVPFVSPGGWHTIYAQAVDTENRVSGITSYAYGMNPGGITSPATGSATQGTVSLAARARSGYSGVTWKYRRGSAESWVTIPVANVKNNGAAVTAWPVATTQSGSDTVIPTLTWDAATSLGVDGNVDLEVCFVNGSELCAPETVSLQLDRDADANPTATTTFGPGTLNLVTGGLTVGATDVGVSAGASELTVTRSYNTRRPVRAVPDAAEHLSENEVDVETGTTGFNAAANVTLSQVSTPVFTQAKALKIEPKATGASNDTFASVGGDQGALRLGMLPGHSYTFTTHIYVPSSTGAPGATASGRADKVVAMWEIAPGVLTELQSTAAAAVYDKWQELTLRFTVPTGSAQAFIRLYNGRPTGDLNSGAIKPVYYDRSSLTDEGIFGPGWMGSLPVGSADSTYAGLTDFGTQVHVANGDGTVIAFAKNSGGQFLPTGDDATSGLVLKPATITNGTAATWTLTDLGGNLSVFVPSATYSAAPTAALPHAYRIDHVTQPGSAKTTTYTYSNDRITEMLAPVPTGVSCTGGAWAKGCRSLQFAYNTSGHLTQVAYKTADASGGAFVVAIACYQYDDGVGTGNTGVLLKYWDPRRVTSGGVSPTCGSPVLATTYGYSATNRLQSLTPPGQAAFTIQYQADGRIQWVNRAHTGGQWGTSSEAIYAVYDIVTSPEPGIPYFRPDLTAAAVAQWGQTDAPVTGVAIYGAGDYCSLADLRDATVYYLNTGGRVVNTAAFGGTVSPLDSAGWHVSTTEYNASGEVVRTLDAANRELALNPSNAPAGLTLPSGSAAAAAALSTVNVYSADGMDVVDTFGPYHLATIPDGTVAAVRTHTHHDYDTGAELAHPAGPTLHLEVSSYTAASRSSAAVATAEVDRHATATKYALSSTDATGWTFRAPMQVVSDPDGLAQSTITRYDPNTGEVVEVRLPSNPTGGGAGSSTSIYYTADASSPDADCRNRPEWVGLLCKVVPAAQPSSATPGLDGRSTRWMQTYDYLNRAVSITETTPGGVSRSFALVFENSGYSPRESQTQLSGGLGAAIPTRTTTYDATTGLPTSYSAASTAENAATTVTLAYDDFGRLRSYDDGSGAAATTTTYDAKGRISVVTDAKGTRTYGYTSGGERRDMPTSVAVSGVGTFSATYGPTGQVASQVWPNGVTQTYTRDQTGQTVADQVKLGSVVWLDESVSPDAYGKWRRRTATIGAASGSTGGTWTYAYDAVDRLVKATDTPAGGTCATRTYAYDATSNRLNSTRYPAGTGGACQNATGGVATGHSYDTADRLLSSGVDTGLAYDALGRITTLPAADTNNAANGNVSATYYADDLVRSLTQGSSSQTWTIDESGRPAARTDRTNGTVTRVVTNHYDNSGNAPAWVSENAAGTSWTRNVVGLSSGLVAVVDESGVVTWQVSNLHGDVVAVATGSAGVPSTGYAADEFGVAQGAAPARYAWLGAKQLAADTPGGLVVMGLRLYAPALGRFLQVDPVGGGSDNAYEYCGANPVTCEDLDGTSKADSNIGGGDSEWKYVHGDPTFGRWETEWQKVKYVPGLLEWAIGMVQSTAFSISIPGTAKLLSVASIEMHKIHQRFREYVTEYYRIVNTKYGKRYQYRDIIERQRQYRVTVTLNFGCALWYCAVRNNIYLHQGWHTVAYLRTEYSWGPLV